MGGSTLPNLRLSNESDAADWITTSPLPWDRLVGFGPGGFESYARLRYVPDPAVEGQRENDVVSHGITEMEAVSQLCRLLAVETATPEDCYFCLWEGWPEAREHIEAKATVHVPNRNYYLFQGSIEDVGRWGLPGEDRMQPAAFIWPADHAWCFASDVDPHWAGIGATKSTIARLLSSGLDIVPADPASPQPTYQ